MVQEDVRGPLHHGEGKGLLGGERGFREGRLVGETKQNCILEQDGCGQTNTSWSDRLSVIIKLGALWADACSPEQSDIQAPYVCHVALN